MDFLHKIAKIINGFSEKLEIKVTKYTKFLQSRKILVLWNMQTSKLQN